MHYATVMPGAPIWRRERPARGGSVASGPATKRMQPGGGRGGHPGSRGSLACDDGESFCRDGCSRRGFCDGCFVCASLAADTHCEPWCNYFTCWVRGGFCEGCYSCGGTPKTFTPWTPTYTTAYTQTLSD